MSIKSSIAAWLVVVVSLTFFVASLFMPVLIFEKEPPVMGIKVLGWGWWGLLTFDFPWFANPAYFLALLFIILKKYRVAQISVLIAIGLGALSFFVHEWYFNEGGGTPVVRLGHAFYFWMASFVVLLIGTTVVKMISNKVALPPPLNSGHPDQNI